jgi:hypothetical protein
VGLPRGTTKKSRRPATPTTDGRWCLHCRRKMVLWSRLPPTKRSSPRLGVRAAGRRRRRRRCLKNAPTELRAFVCRGRTSRARLKPGPKGKRPGGIMRPKGSARYKALISRLQARAWGLGGPSQKRPVLVGCLDP